MRYWSVLLLYIFFVLSCFSYYGIAKECGADKPVVTGAACSIKDLPKLDKNGEVIKSNDIEKGKNLKKDKTQSLSQKKIKSK